MKSKVSIGEYLAFLSTKFQINPDHFFEALVSAEKDGEAKCGELSFECRSNTPDKIVMLITKGPKVAAQFPLAKEFLEASQNPIKAP
ncbi:MAG: hypothetical protein AB1457_19210, partial [Chloroflexota bacterium]